MRIVNRNPKATTKSAFIPKRDDFSMALDDRA